MSIGEYESSQVQYDVVLEKNVMVVMRDGTRLATDVYRPALFGKPVDGEFPTILERTPYDNGSARLVNIGRYFARRGYVCILQDVRGRGESDGDWFFLLNPNDEGKDGHDCLQWIVGQAWSDGQVGTIGVSYTGATQQAMAVTKPPGLKAQFIIDSGYNYHTHTLRSGGAFGMGVVFPYAFRMARDGKEAQDDPNILRSLTPAFHNMAEWLRHLPLKRGMSPLALAPTYDQMLFEIASHGDYDEFWANNPAASMEAHVENYADVPVFLLTSWYGHHVWATTTKFVELRKRLESPVRMVIGTWLHGYESLLETWSGEVDFGIDAIMDNIQDLRLKWFDHHLKGMRTDVLDGPPIDMFVMGGGDGLRNLQGHMNHGGYWRTEHDWPLPGTVATNYYLQPDGGLGVEIPPRGAPPSRYAFDPNNPVPTLGGCIQTPRIEGIVNGGAYDQRGRPELFFSCSDSLPLAARGDVLVFQTPPLDEDLEVTGPVTVELWASSSATDTDFTAKLLDVCPSNRDYPDGFAMNLCDGIIRARYRESREREKLLNPGGVYSFTIDLQATGNVFKKGHRVRIDISSSSFPQYDVNPNTGAPLWSSAENQIAYQSVHHDSEYPSHVVLPVISVNRG